jgi:hypothetical protein
MAVTHRVEIDLPFIPSSVSQGYDAGTHTVDLGLDFTEDEARRAVAAIGPGAHAVRLDRDRVGR